MIDEDLAVFERLCQYSYPIYPQLTANYIGYYRDYCDLDYTENSEVSLFNPTNLITIIAALVPR
ncbi:hypothetical protein LQZ18_01980 [Lachnospiraceae bacterium ZAX-1]